MTPADRTFVIPSIRPTVTDVLSQLLAQQVSPADVIVVDDSTDARVTEAVSSLPVRLLHTNGAGNCAARNVGAAASATEWIVFLDDDVALGPRAVADLDQLLEGISHDQRVGAIEIRIQPTGAVVRQYWRNRLVESTRPGGFLTACLVVRSEAFYQTSGFRARVRRGYREDTAFGLAVREAGWVTTWSDGVQVAHPIEHVGLRAFLGRALLFRHDAWFRRRHPGYLDSVSRRRTVLGIPVGRLRSKLPILSVLVSAVLAVLGRRPRRVIPAILLASGVA
ncbi:MAG: glycosyltransferase, partial [Candidatus Dormiibacterota bacterium]